MVDNFLARKAREAVYIKRDVYSSVKLSFSHLG